jgi:FAD/FMN-containing dehydrogenase
MSSLKDALSRALGKDLLVVSNTSTLVAAPSSTTQAAELLRLLGLHRARARIMARISDGGDGRAGPDLILSTSRLTSLPELDLGSMTITAGAGLRIGAIEETARTRGLTLGARALRARARTVGGALADDRALSGLSRLVVGLEAVSGAGQPIAVRAAPRRATGPDVTAALVGLRGQGALLTQATLRLSRQPEKSEERRIRFGRVEDGLRFLHAVAHEDLQPLWSELHTSDGTEVALELGGPAPVLEQELLIVEELATAQTGTLLSDRKGPSGTLIGAAQRAPFGRLAGLLEEAQSRHKNAWLGGFATDGGELLVGDPDELKNPMEGPLQRLEAVLRSRLDPAATLTP